MKNCQIRHTCGEEEEDAGISVEEAIVIAENAISEGNDCQTVPDMSAKDITAAPANSIVTLGGKNCKWCGSSTHSRKSHKDCPQNPKHASNSNNRKQSCKS